MWEAMDSDPCDICQYTRNQTFNENVEGQYINKENLCPTKHDDLSLYETATTVQISCVNAAHHYPRARRSLDDIETISQDSGYANSYHGEAARYLSFNSPPRSSISFGSGSVGFMEDDFLEDFSDVEPLDKPSTLPRDFNKLINEPLIHRAKSKSPKDSNIRPLFRRALSLQNSRTTPSSSKVRTSLFGGDLDTENRPFKRPDPPANIDQAIIKKSKLYASQQESLTCRPPLKRAISATEESIMCAVQKSSTEPDLIGDFSKCFSLPLVNGKHQDLKAISPETLARLINGEFSNMVESFKVIDCRYPYEYIGGHIDGAVNIYTKEQIGELFNENQIPFANPAKRHILVFHCEFSSERGPNLYRYLRRADRKRNEAAYPSLHYPEIYLLEGGYKGFFQKFSGMCEPVAYKEMLHPDHEEDLRLFRQKSKTWNVDSKHRPSKSMKRL